MLAEKPTITVLKEHRLIDVTTKNQSITAARLSLPEKTTVTIKARLFIAASYEGDLPEFPGGSHDGAALSEL